MKNVPTLLHFFHVGISSSNIIVEMELHQLLLHKELACTIAQICLQYKDVMYKDVIYKDVFTIISYIITSTAFCFFTFGFYVISPKANNLLTIRAKKIKICLTSFFYA